MAKFLKEGVYSEKEICSQPTEDCSQKSCCGGSEEPTPKKTEPFTVIMEEPNKPVSKKSHKEILKDQEFEFKLDRPS